MNARPSQPIRLHRHPLWATRTASSSFSRCWGLPFERIDVDLARGAQRAPEFLALNPFGEVPVIEDGGLVVADSTAILVYLAARYDQEGRWHPREPAGAAAVQRWFAIAAGPLVQGPNLARVEALFRRPRDPNRAVIAARLFTVMDVQLALRPWLAHAAEGPTLADLALYTYTAHAPEGGIGLEALPLHPRVARPHRGAAGLHRHATKPAPRAARGAVRKPVAKPEHPPVEEAFHPGERALQSRAGAREALAAVGARDPSRLHAGASPRAPRQASLRDPRRARRRAPSVGRAPRRSPGLPLDAGRAHPAHRHRPLASGASRGADAYRRAGRPARHRAADAPAQPRERDDCRGGRRPLHGPRPAKLRQLPQVHPGAPACARRAGGRRREPLEPGGRSPVAGAATSYAGPTPSSSRRPRPRCRPSGASASTSLIGEGSPASCAAATKAARPF